MFELNSREIKNVILPKKMKHLQGTIQTLACVIDTWQSTSEVNGQCPNWTFRTNFAGIYKIGDQICELNYRGTKSIIGEKMRNQIRNWR